MQSTFLPTGWLTVLQNPQKCSPYVSVIIDEGGLNIKLERETGPIEVGTFDSGVDIDPDINEIPLSDLTLKFINSTENFSPLSLRSGVSFRGVTRVTSGASTATGVNLKSGIGEFKTGDIIKICDDTNQESVTLTGATTNAVSWTNGAVTNTYAAGSYVSSVPLFKKSVSIYLKLKEVSGYILLFKGVIREPFEVSENVATLKIYNAFGDIFNQNLKIHSTSLTPLQVKGTSNNFESSFSWSSGATTTLDDITVYSCAKIGTWTVTIGYSISADKPFFVVDPDGVEYTGNTGTDFYTGTDATDSLIKIASADWTTPTENDVLTFQISANLSGTVTEMLYEILHNYAGISDTYIDVGGTGVSDSTYATRHTFNKLYSIENARSSSYKFSFNQADVSILEALFTISPHIKAFIGQGRYARFRIFSLDKDFKLDAVTPIIVENPSISKTLMINKFILHYDWNNATNEYRKTKIYPEDESNISSKLHGDMIEERDVYCPAITN